MLEHPRDAGTTALSVPGRLIRRIEQPADVRAAARLYRDVFGYARDEGGIPARLLVALQRNSGIALGAFDGDHLAGFVYSFLAREEGSGRLYQYSQLAVVAESHQGQGIGRALKLRQREETLSMGLDLIRWAFDPLRARNAHFNFDVLGAASGTILPDLYGVEVDGSERGDCTDRLVVDWELTVPAQRRHFALPDVPPPYGEPTESADGTLLAIPADWDAYRAGPDGQRLRASVRHTLQMLFSEGKRAVSCRRIPGSPAAVYLLTGAEAQHR